MAVMNRAAIRISVRLVIVLYFFHFFVFLILLQ
jgi:hypothetical protein